MTESVSLVLTKDIQPNPENPRLIFHQDELDALQESISKQGILVPLTLYREKTGFRILDGERRWRSAIKLGLSKVPAIIQPKPDRLQNLLMMFAIHHRRNEWDPLPTALKLEVLEKLYVSQHRTKPTEKQLAELASLTRGEVRRYKKLLSLPEHYKEMLMSELEKPRSKQLLTVDHVLEATAAATALKKRLVISGAQEEKLRSVIVDKYISGVIGNTVEPRKFARLARAVQREEITLDQAKVVVKKFIQDPKYTIENLFTETVEEVDFQHGIELVVERLDEKIDRMLERSYVTTDNLKNRLKMLQKKIKSLLGN